MRQHSACGVLYKIDSKKKTEPPWCGSVFTDFIVLIVYMPRAGPSKDLINSFLAFVRWAGTGSSGVKWFSPYCMFFFNTSTRVCALSVILSRQALMFFSLSSFGYPTTAFTVSPWKFGISAPNGTPCVNLIPLFILPYCFPLCNSFFLLSAFFTIY